MSSKVRLCSLTLTESLMTFFSSILVNLNSASTASHSSQLYDRQLGHSSRMLPPYEMPSCLALQMLRSDRCHFINVPPNTMRSSEIQNSFSSWLGAAKLHESAKMNLPSIGSGSFTTELRVGLPSTAALLLPSSSLLSFCEASQADGMLRFGY